MNPTKEQMLKWLDRHGWTAESIPIVDAIRALIESSGDKEQETDPFLSNLYGVKSAPSPAPTIKQDLTVGPSVEEAIKCMEQNAPWGYDDDGPQERQEHETHMAALAVLKAALRPKVVSRGWVGELVEVARWGDKDGGYARVKSRLCSELGVVVGD
jgi:hypothetical protein